MSEEASADPLPAEFTVHLLDPGQEKYGDCILCRFGPVSVLIDGAHPGDHDGSPGHESIPRQLSRLLGQSAPPYRVSLLVVTHCHVDHTGCLPALGETRRGNSMAKMSQKKVEEIVRKGMPGARVARRPEGADAPGHRAEVDAVSPDLDALRRKYLGPDAASASAAYDSLPSAARGGSALPDQRGRRDRGGDEGRRELGYRRRPEGGRDIGPRGEDHRRPGLGSAFGRDRPYGRPYGRTAHEAPVYTLSI